MKVKIVTDEELPADTVVIHCRDVDENILRLKRAAEAMGSADVAFFKGGKQFSRRLTLYYSLRPRAIFSAPTPRTMFFR